MRALVWHGPGQMSVDDLPDPEPGEVLLVPELTVLPTALQAPGRTS